MPQIRAKQRFPDAGVELSGRAFDCRSRGLRIKPGRPLLQEMKRNIFLRISKNDIPIDVACHRYTLNMQVSSGTKNNFSPNEPACTTVTVLSRW
ncbi:hypothetical protein TNCV_2525821 [Trichonephila clavipes]|nr:hypothetical protein TNCV_2525821 [Trichonephila clavipes]